MMDALFVALAASEIGYIWGVLLIVAAVTALAVLGRRPILSLLRPLLRWLGIRTPDVAPLDEPSGEIPPFVDQAMGHRRPGPRVQPVVCPESSDATQVLPRYDLDDATVVMYVVHPVDERERVR